MTLVNKPEYYEYKFIAPFCVVTLMYMCLGKYSHNDNPIGYVLLPFYLAHIGVFYFIKFKNIYFVMMYITGWNLISALLGYIIEKYSNYDVTYNLLLYSLGNFTLICIFLVSVSILIIIGGITKFCESYKDEETDHIIV